VNTQDGGVSLIADWDIGPATLTSVTAWRYWDWDVANDRDYTGIPIQMVQRIPSRQDQYSQEFRIASNGDSRLNYVAGLYYFSQEISGHPTSIYGPEAAYWLLNPANFSVPIPRNLLDGYGQEGDSRFEMKSYAAFGEANYELTKRLTATLGLRYTYEDKEGTYATRVFLDYEVPVGTGAFLIHVDSNSRSGYYSDTSASRYTWIDGYNVTNASVGYRFKGGWEVDMFARNLFDSDYITALTIQTGNSGLILGQPSDPRMVGVTLRTSF
jgi:outer membrane receptor protein involved in Fe transport